MAPARWLAWLRRPARQQRSKLGAARGAPAHAQRPQQTSARLHSCTAASKRPAGHCAADECMISVPVAAKEARRRWWQRSGAATASNPLSLRRCCTSRNLAVPAALLHFVITLLLYNAAYRWAASCRPKVAGGGQQLPCHKK